MPEVMKRWTLDDRLRQPVFLGMTDKQAKDVVRE
jgi:hypothetical protein